MDMQFTNPVFRKYVQSISKEQRKQLYNKIKETHPFKVAVNQISSNTQISLKRLSPEDLKKFNCVNSFILKPITRHKEDEIKIISSNFEDKPLKCEDEKISNTIRSPSNLSSTNLQTKDLNLPKRETMDSSHKLMMIDLFDNEDSSLKIPEHKKTSISPVHISSDVKKILGDVSRRKSFFQDERQTKEDKKTDIKARRKSVFDEDKKKSETKYNNDKKTEDKIKSQNLEKKSENKQKTDEKRKSKYDNENSVSTEKIPNKRLSRRKSICVDQPLKMEQKKSLDVKFRRKSLCLEQSPEHSPKSKTNTQEQDTLSRRKSICLEKSPNSRNSIQKENIPSRRTSLESRDVTPKENKKKDTYSRRKSICVEQPQNIVETPKSGKSTKDEQKSRIISERKKIIGATTPKKKETSSFFHSPPLIHTRSKSTEKVNNFIDDSDISKSSRSKNKEISSENLRPKSTDKNIDFNKDSSRSKSKEKIIPSKRSRSKSTDKIEQAKLSRSSSDINKSKEKIEKIDPVKIFKSKFTDLVDTSSDEDYPPKISRIQNSRTIFLEKLEKAKRSKLELEQEIIDKKRTKEHSKKSRLEVNKISKNNDKKPSTNSSSKKTSNRPTKHPKMGTRDKPTLNQRLNSKTCNSKQNLNSKGKPKETSKKIDERRKSNKDSRKSISSELSDDASPVRFKRKIVSSIPDSPESDDNTSRNDDSQSSLLPKRRDITKEVFKDKQYNFTDKSTMNQSVSSNKFIRSQSSNTPKNIEERRKSNKDSRKSISSELSDDDSPVRFKRKIVSSIPDSPESDDNTSRNDDRQSSLLPKRRDITKEVFKDKQYNFTDKSTMNQSVSSKKFLRSQFLNTPKKIEERRKSNKDSRKSISSEMSDDDSPVRFKRKIVSSIPDSPESDDNTFRNDDRQSSLLPKRRDITKEVFKDKQYNFTDKSTMNQSVSSKKFLRSQFLKTPKKIEEKRKSNKDSRKSISSELSDDDSPVIFKRKIVTSIPDSPESDDNTSRNDNQSSLLPKRRDITKEIFTDKSTMNQSKRNKFRRSLSLNITDSLEKKQEERKSCSGRTEHKSEENIPSKISSRIKSKCESSYEPAEITNKRSSTPSRPRSISESSNFISSKPAKISSKRRSTCKHQSVFSVEIEEGIKSPNEEKRRFYSEAIASYTIPKKSSVASQEGNRSSFLQNCTEGQSEHNFETNKRHRGKSPIDTNPEKKRRFSKSPMKSSQIETEKNVSRRISVEDTIPDAVINYGDLIKQMKNISPNKTIDFVAPLATETKDKSVFSKPAYGKEDKTEQMTYDTVIVIPEDQSCNKIIVRRRSVQEIEHNTKKIIERRHSFHFEETVFKEEENEEPNVRIRRKSVDEVDLNEKTRKGILKRPSSEDVSSTDQSITIDYQDIDKIFPTLSKEDVITLEVSSDDSSSPKEEILIADEKEDKSKDSKPSSESALAEDIDIDNQINIDINKAPVTNVNLPEIGKSPDVSTPIIAVSSTAQSAQDIITTEQAVVSTKNYFVSLLHIYERYYNTKLETEAQKKLGMCPDINSKKIYFTKRHKIDIEKLYQKLIKINIKHFSIITFFNLLIKLLKKEFDSYDYITEIVILFFLRKTIWILIENFTSPSDNTFLFNHITSCETVEYLTATELFKHSQITEKDKFLIEAFEDFSYCPNKTLSPKSATQNNSVTVTETEQQNLQSKKYGQTAVLSIKHISSQAVDRILKSSSVENQNKEITMESNKDITHIHIPKPVLEISPNIYTTQNTQQNAQNYVISNRHVAGLQSSPNIVQTGSVNAQNSARTNRQTSCIQHAPNTVQTSQNSIGINRQISCIQRAPNSVRINPQTSCIQHSPNIIHPQNVQMNPSHNLDINSNCPNVKKNPPNYTEAIQTIKQNPKTGMNMHANIRTYQKQNPVQTSSNTKLPNKGIKILDVVVSKPNEEVPRIKLVDENKLKNSESVRNSLAQLLCTTNHKNSSFGTLRQNNIQNNQRSRILTMDGTILQNQTSQNMAQNRRVIQAPVQNVPISLVQPNNRNQDSNILAQMLQQNKIGTQSIGSQPTENQRLIMARNRFMAQYLAQQNLNQNGTPQAPHGSRAQMTPQQYYNIYTQVTNNLTINSNLPYNYENSQRNELVPNLYHPPTLGKINSQMAHHINQISPNQTQRNSSQPHTANYGVVQQSYDMNSVSASDRSSQQMIKYRLRSATIPNNHDTLKDNQDQEQNTSLRNVSRDSGYFSPVDNIQNPDTDLFCERCFKPSSFMCSGCYTYYCSIYCQVQAWPEHVKRCFTRS